MMTESDVFEKTKAAYLGLVRPCLPGSESAQDIALLLTLAPSVPDALAAQMIVGASWRERLLGLCIAMSRQEQPPIFVEKMLQSLREPRGLSIVPTCAALAVLAKRGAFVMTESFSPSCDRTAFRGEVGWAIDKAMYFAGLLKSGVQGAAGPNSGQSFEEQVQFYSSLHPEA